MRVVIDTNVIISRYLSPHGSPAQVLSSWEKGRFDLLVSPAILREYERVFRYPRIKKHLALSEEKIAAILDDFSELAETIVPTKSLSVVTTDPDDNKFIECAVAGDADYIVTGDPHLVDLGKYRGIFIVPPAVFLVFLEHQYCRAA